MKSLFLLTLLCLAVVARAEDPYEPNERFTSGQNRGKQIASTFTRPAKIVTDPVVRASVGAQEGDIVIANFMHNRRFWLARIPKDAVQDVMVLEQYPMTFGPSMHLLTRFQLKPGMGAQLFKQNPDQKMKPPPEPLQDIIVHGIGLFPKGEMFSKPKTHMGHYYNLSALTESMDVLKSDNRVWKTTIKQTRLAVSPEKKQALLGAALGIGEKLGFDTPFNPWTQNCHTVTLSILDSVLRPRHLNRNGLSRLGFTWNAPGFLGRHVFPSVESVLRNSKAYDPQVAQMQTLNDEWEGKKPAGACGNSARRL